MLLILWNELSAGRFKLKNSACWAGSFFGYEPGWIYLFDDLE